MQLWGDAGFSLILGQLPAVQRAVIHHCTQLLLQQELPGAQLQLAFDTMPELRLRFGAYGEPQYLTQVPLVCALQFDQDQMILYQPIPVRAPDGEQTTGMALHTYYLTDPTALPQLGQQLLQLVSDYFLARRWLAAATGAES